jgi:hypothetical protein
MSPVIAPAPPAPAPTAADVWNATDDPHALLDIKFPMGGADSVIVQTRKSKLYYVACAARLPFELPWVLRTLIEYGRELAETPLAYTSEFRAQLRSIAEEMANTADLECAIEQAEGRLARRGVCAPSDTRDSLSPDPQDWLGLAYLAAAPLSRTTPLHRYVPAALHSVACARDIFEPGGIPRVSFSPEWRSTPVLALADRMYRDQDFDGMPVLHDALMEAGCAADAMLDHCKTPHGHVRGCWVVDMILRKPS